MVATNFSTKKPPTLGVRFSSHLTLHFNTSVKKSEGTNKRIIYLSDKHTGLKQQLSCSLITCQGGIEVFEL